MRETGCRERGSVCSRCCSPKTCRAATGHTLGFVPRANFPARCGAQHRKHGVRTFDQTIYIVYLKNKRGLACVRNRYAALCRRYVRGTNSLVVDLFEGVYVHGRRGKGRKSSVTLCWLVVCVYFCVIKILSLPLFSPTSFFWRR